ncbi:hypothetical protein LEN26_011784 [Aphanomyces euteiches]|nr:hypothetical protein AeMF1_018594 [Aphanomyces euteiches]KAH9119121.1 hypothetical protein LEN26_011784 [Aphanomyces euteiches]KAH9187520.1 hypothetical protein AeNC1_010508 [Aphanomyces euteiches]
MEIPMSVAVLCQAIFQFAFQVQTMNTATQHLRQLSEEDGLAGAQVLIIVLAVIVAALFVYGAIKTKYANHLRRQRRESTADTVIEWEIESPKATAFVEVEIQTPKPPAIIV